MRRQSPRPRKPLSLPVLHMLLALADGAMHGYAIKREVERRTEGTIRLGPGTLYEAIDRLDQARVRYIRERLARGEPIPVPRPPLHSAPPLRENDAS